MKTFALSALAATFALGACAEANAPEADGDGTSETVVAPAATETTVVREVDSQPDGDRVTIGEDGIEADITDGNTRVRVDGDGSPGITVETD